MNHLATALALLLVTPAAAETLTAARLIRPSAILTEADIARSNEIIPGALSGDEAIVGLEARITLYPGRAIRPGDVGPPALIERNQLVTLVFEGNGLRITTEGRALSRGAYGEVVRAMNLSSRSTVSGLVSSQGLIRVVP